jgi:hypothetical protein
MRRAALVLFALTVLFVPDYRPAGALPANGIERYYYANACDPLYRVGPGQPGDFLGQRITSCSTISNTISESQLVGLDNWKDEIVYDCETGYWEETWYHGGYMHWTAATPADCVYSQ